MSYEDLNIVIKLENDLFHQNFEVITIPQTTKGATMLPLTQLFGVLTHFKY